MWPAGATPVQLCVPPTPAPSSSGSRYRKRGKQPRTGQAALAASGPTLGAARDALGRTPWGQPGTPASLLPIWPVVVASSGTADDIVHAAPQHPRSRAQSAV
eukprot:9682579-Alexandrium_andersonii.AAC.1